MSRISDTPYNPLTKAQSFAKLTSDGLSADRAFVVLALVTANAPASPLDAAHMAEIRELALAYVEHTGQESLMWSYDELKAKGER